MTTDNLLTRAARIEDAADIARLSGELGYACGAEEMTTRLTELLNQQNQLVVVAAREDGACLLGWVAAECRLRLESGRAVEIVGLVVDASARRLGVGARLICAAERWARESGCQTMVVRSNAARVESHPFYARHGYARTKTQHVYSKQLSD